MVADLGSQRVAVLVVPADRNRPLQLKNLAPSAFEAELGGRPEAVLPIVASAPPVDWMLFVAAGRSVGSGPANSRAQLLCTHLGGAPGRTLPGTVLFTGRAPGQRVRGVPGIFSQLATLLGLQVRSTE